MNLLLTSVGRRSYLVEYFKKALEGQGKVFVANSTALSPAFLVADEAVIVPEIYDPHYIPFLLRYCAEKDIKAIISLFDIDLPILARHKQDFEGIGTKVLVSDSDFIDICNDKWKTYQFLKKNGFQTPETYLELDKAKQDLMDRKLHYPLMVKPRWGMGSIAVYEADNEAELDVLYLKIKRDIEKSYLKYESAQNMEESVIVQEKIDGQEYGMDVINDLEGRYINAIVKMKRAMRFGETDCAMTVEEPVIRELGEEIAKISHHIGNLDVDLFKTQDGTCYVLEMNARFGGGYPFSHMAGVNLPQAIVNWLSGKPAEESLFIPRIGVSGQKDIKIIEL